ncbi:Conserved_hypothetical protein [Hexamita inflata]|uniref:Uncharacterized protein n=1 Tax=Hexamita inflata TaxID=28002 RepID=A0AA86NQA0_9EUKA|nr:Conserved hypothetical protein [Hexamita inflata]
MLLTLQLDDLLFVTKINSFNIYLAFYTSSICLLDQTQKCINKISINTNFQSNIQQKFLYCVQFRKWFESLESYKSCKINRGFLNHPVIYNGLIYFTYFDNLYSSDGLTVNLVQQIPNYQYGFRHNNNDRFPGGELFTLNNKLFLQNHSRQLYQLHQNKLHQVSYNHKNKFYYQFCDKVYCLHNNCIYQVQNKVKSLKCLIQVMQLNLLFNSGGTLIIYCNYQYQNRLIVLNMLDGEIVPVQNQELFKTDIQQLLCLGSTGVQLKNSVLEELFGLDFPLRLQQYYESYQNKLRISFEQIINSLRITNITQNKTIDGKYQQTRRNIYDKQRQINECVGKLISLQTQMIVNSQIEDLQDQ